MLAEFGTGHVDGSMLSELQPDGGSYTKKQLEAMGVESNKIARLARHDLNSFRLLGDIWVLG